MCGVSEGGFRRPPVPICGRYLCERWHLHRLLGQVGCHAGSQSRVHRQESDHAPPHISRLRRRSLAAPAIARGEASQVLKFVPQADLAVLDPVWTTTYQTRDHGFLVFDTLFGLDSQFKAQPQMAEGAVSEDDGKTWRITLRPT